MKKSIFNTTAFAVAVAAALFCVTCGDRGPDATMPVTPTTYAATVSSDGTGYSGGGSYAAGSTVAIYAGSPPSGQAFKNWTTSDGVAFADADSATTTFTMPSKAVTVTAVFEATYLVTVTSAGTGSSGGGSYVKGATVTIKAGTPPSGQAFKNWTAASGGVTFANADSATTTFTMPGNAATVTAVFEAIPVSTYLVTVTSAGTSSSGGGSYAAGATVTIKAGTAPSGQQFKNWTTASAGVTFANANSASTSFTMPGNAATVTAVFEAIPVSTYLVTVSSAGTGATGGGNYAAGATVTISAGTPPSGQKFKNWTTASAGVTFANANSATTTFTMPANAATVTAVFEANVNYGTLNDSRDGKTYKTVVIDGQTWMAENLNYETSSDSWCYGNSTDNCAKYGRLYTWSAAKSACPNGWQLPDTADWRRLVEKAGGENTAGMKLKSTSGWHDNGNGTDDFGFSALPGGNYVGGIFNTVGEDGNWWTTTERDSYAYKRFMYHLFDRVGEGDALKSDGYSVRCVKENSAYAATVTGGTGATGSGNYAAGATVTISAGTPPSGQQFKNWTTASAGVTFANANSATTTFTMPANAVTVIAWFIVDPSTVVKSTFTDNRTNQTYNTVKIGNQTWMAENLNYTPSSGNSWCYGNKPDSCVKYGRLYDWATAMGLEASYNSGYWNGSDVKHRGVCPTGWHLPSYREWGDLVIAAGGTDMYYDGTAGTTLKSTSGWKSYNGVSGNGTDDFGFSALPSGFRYPDDGTFYDAGFTGYWFTATEITIDNAYLSMIDYNYENDYIIVVESGKNYGRSVRCVQD